MSKQQEIELNSRYKDANVINRTKHSLPKSGEGLGVETISYQRVQRYHRLSVMNNMSMLFRAAVPSLFGTRDRCS